MTEKDFSEADAVVERIDNVLLRLQVVCIRLSIVENMLDVFEGMKPRPDAVEEEGIGEVENTQITG